MADSTSIKIEETPGRTIVVALILCLVCSILVSASAVFLKSRRQYNEAIDIKKNILQIAELEYEDNSVEEVFSERIVAQIIDVKTGKVSNDIDLKSFNQMKAASNPDFSEAIPNDQDVAGIKVRSRYAKVYLVKKNDIIEQVILPVKGKGLWSTMYGLISVDNKAEVIKGFGFYEQKETPGLGGEVDNPRWKKSWRGKKIYNDDGEVVFSLTKNSAEKNPYGVDTLSGATITSQGVESMIHYWLGENGFKPFLNDLKEKSLEKIF